MTDDKDTRRDFYVYVFERDGTPVYVGKGRGNRWLRPFRHTSHNPHLYAILKKDERDGTSRISRRKMVDGLSEPEALAVEIDLIACIGRRPDGPLVNLTDGGEGLTNPSAETRARLRISHTGKTWSAELRANFIAARTGIPMDPKTKEKIGNANRGRVHSQETREKNRLARFGQSLSAEHRASLSKGHKGRVFSEEVREKIRVSNTGKRHSEQTRAKMREAQKNRTISPEAFERMAATMRGKKFSPEALERRQAAFARTIAARRASGAKLISAAIGRKMSPKAIAKRQASRAKNLEHETDNTYITVIRKY
jgi:hypothetical protein